MLPRLLVLLLPLLPPREEAVEPRVLELRIVGPEQQPGHQRRMLEGGETSREQRTG